MVALGFVLGLPWPQGLRPRENDPSPTRADEQAFPASAEIALVGRDLGVAPSAPTSLDPNALLIRVTDLDGDAVPRVTIHVDAREAGRELLRMPWSAHSASVSPLDDPSGYEKWREEALAEWAREDKASGSKAGGE